MDATLANGIGGKFEANRLGNVTVGSTLAAMEVSAEGDWTIDIKPVSDARRWNASKDLKGRWDDVVTIEPGSFAALDGLVYDAQGDSNFIVEVYTEDGRGDLVVTGLWLLAAVASHADGRWDDRGLLSVHHREC